MTNNLTDDYNRIADASDAFTMIDRMTTCDCADPIPRTRTCLHSDSSTALRDLLIDRNYSPDHSNDNPLLNDPDYPIYDFIRAMLALIDIAPYQTDRMTALLLDNSLCPMHAIDYAICFDDDEPDCAAIRAIHPSHDT
jgi:hypothetical protein